MKKMSLWSGKMTKNKRITLLEEKVSELEKALCTLISSTQGTESQEKTELSYEEVIDQWLNGKKS